MLNSLCMNEFVAKKMGEVLAFCRVGADTINRGREALTEALGAERILDLEEKNRLHGESIVRIATQAAVQNPMLAKADKTEQKLKAMRDLYVGDQWDNATELMEWSGFFEGAAIVHWALIRGCAQGLDDETLLMLAEEAINWHYELLEMCETEISEEGADKGVN